MKKKWRYIHYDVATDSVALGNEIKELEIIAVNSPGSDYVEVFDELKIYIKSKTDEYNKFRREGQKYYDEIRVNYIIDIETGNLSLSDAHIIDDLIRPVTIELESGSWHTGYQRALVLVVDSLFTQVMKDSLVGDITTYINNNYPIELHV